MEKSIIFHNGETVDIKKSFNIEEGKFTNQLIFTGLDNEQKEATMSFDKEEDRDTMYDKFEIVEAEGFSNFMRG